MGLTEVLLLNFAAFLFGWLIGHQKPGDNSDSVKNMHVSTDKDGSSTVYAVTGEGKLIRARFNKNQVLMEHHVDINLQ